MSKRPTLWIVVSTVAFVGVLFVAVFPTRTFLAQRASMGAAEEQLTVLGEQNHLLEERVRLLNDDAEIERLARQEYYLVRPGEEAYALLPTPAPPEPPPPVGVPPAEPGHRNLAQRAWDWLAERL